MRNAPPPIILTPPPLAEIEAVTAELRRVLAQIRAAAEAAADHEKNAVSARNG